MLVFKFLATVLKEILSAILSILKGIGKYMIVMYSIMYGLSAIVVTFLSLIGLAPRWIIWVEVAIIAAILLVRRFIRFTKEERKQRKTAELEK